MPLQLPPCLEPGCHKRVSKKGRCEDHQRPAFANNFRAERLPPDWRQRREIVLRRDTKYCDFHGRDEVFCYLCGECGADTVDHIINNDDDDFDNLGSVHDRVFPHCHRTKTAQEGNNARREQRVTQWGNTWAEEYYRRKNEI